MCNIYIVLNASKTKSSPLMSALDFSNLRHLAARKEIIAIKLINNVLFPYAQ